jgi:hypothetical protein
MLVEISFYTGILTFSLGSFRSAMKASFLCSHYTGILSIRF